MASYDLHAITYVFKAVYVNKRLSINSYSCFQFLRELNDLESTAVTEKQKKQMFSKLLNLTHNKMKVSENPSI